MEGLATSREVADYLGVKPQTMDAWASKKKGPPFSKIEGRRRYDWKRVEEWAHKGRSTRNGPVYMCSTCRTPVTGHGHIVVDLAEVDRYQRESVSDPFAEPAAWGILHDDCEPARPVRSGYYIDIERAATWPQLLSWIAHLAEKNWFASTDLTGLLRKIGVDR